MKKGNIGLRFYKLITFNNDTYRSVFNEGSRRLVVILSVVTPILLGLLFSLIDDGETGLLIGMFSYFPFHIVILLYIWVREGKKTVAPGGNALRTILNILILHFVLAGIVVSLIIYVEENENPFTNEFYLSNSLPKEFKYNQSNVQRIYKRENGLHGLGSYPQYLKALSTYRGRSEILKIINRDNETRWDQNILDNYIFIDLNRYYAKSIFENLNLEKEISFTNFCDELLIDQIFNVKESENYLLDLITKNTRFFNDDYSGVKSKLYIFYEH